MTDIKDKQCFKVDELEDHEVYAIRAVGEGKATEYQQQLAIQVIVKKFSRVHDLLFIPGSQDETAFLSGRAFVGS